MNFIRGIINIHASDYEHFLMDRSKYEPGYAGGPDAASKLYLLGHDFMSSFRGCEYL